MFSGQWGNSNGGGGGQKFQGSKSGKRGASGGWRGRGGYSGGRAAKAPRQNYFNGVSFALTSPTMVSISSKYSERLNEIWRKRGASFSKERREWTVSLSAYPAILADLEGNEVRELPGMITKHITASSEFKSPTPTISAVEARAAWEASLPPRLRSSLMPFQQTGITLAIQRGGRVLIGDEMGLGKTLQALSVAYHYNADWPLLIICPSSLRHTWAGEIAKWLEIDDESIQIITSSKQRPDSLIVIVSYDIAAKIADALAAFKVIIADEAHYLKSPDAKRTKAITPLVRKAKRSLLLTGTPALSRPIELFPLLNSLEPDVFSSAVQFGIRYAAGFEGPYGWDFTGASNLGELHVVVTNTVLIRRLKKDVLHQLPPKSRQQVFIEIAAKHRKELAALQKQAAAIDVRIQSSTGTTKQAAENERRSLTVKMYSLTGQAKVPGVLSYLDELIDRDIKLLIFGHHRETLDAISAHLSQKKLRHIRIDGQTPQHLRQEHCTRFQEDPATKAAVLSITAAGVGLTLHAASTVVFCELFWNPGQLLQAEDRAHRMGQQKSVDIKYVIGRGTLDDSQWQLVQKKISIVGQSVNGASDTGDLELDRDKSLSASSSAPAESSSDQPALTTFFKSKGVHDSVMSPMDKPLTAMAQHEKSSETAQCELCGVSVSLAERTAHVAACAAALTEGIFDD